MSRGVNKKLHALKQSFDNFRTFCRKRTRIVRNIDTFGNIIFYFFQEPHFFITFWIWSFPLILHLLLQILYLRFILLHNRHTIINPTTFHMSSCLSNKTQCNLSNLFLSTELNQVKDDKHPRTVRRITFERSNTSCRNGIKRINLK